MAISSVIPLLSKIEIPRYAESFYGNQIIDAVENAIFMHRIIL